MAQSSASNTMSSGATPQPTAHVGTGRQPEGQQPNAPEGTLLDTALQGGKKWIEDSGVLNGVNQLPQALKDFGNRAVARVGDLSTTQKVVGGAILAVGLGWLATRKGKSSSPYNYGSPRDAGSYGRRNYGYQAPDAATSRRPVAGSGRTDSGSPYGNGGKGRYGSAGIFSGGADSAADASSPGSGAGFGAAPANEYGSRTSESSPRKNDDFRRVE